MLPEDIYRGNMPTDEESFNLVASLERKYGPSYFMQSITVEPIGKRYPILFPLDDLSKKETPTATLTHLMRLMKIFEKIMILNQSNAVEYPDIIDLRGQIDISLQNWDISFRTWLAKDSFLTLADRSSLPNAPWISTFLEVVYNFCLICLHRPLILKDFLLNSDNQFFFHHPSYSIAENAANSISIVLQKNDFANFFINAPSFTHTILFHCGLTYGMLLYIYPHSPNSNRYIRQINSCISALSTISKFFSPTRNKWDVLRKIATSFYKKKSDKELAVQWNLFKESILIGYPLIGQFVSTEDIEEYTKSREILTKNRSEIL